MDLTGADLRGAILYRVNFRGAYIHETYLSGVELAGAKGILIIFPCGGHDDMLVAVIHPDGWRITSGFFWGTLTEFKEKIEFEHERERIDDKMAALYRVYIAMLRSIEQIYIDEMMEEREKEKEEGK